MLNTLNVHHHEATTVNEAIKSVSAVKKYPRAKKPRGGENVLWKRIKSLDASVLDANRIGRDAASVIGRLLLFKHITPLQAEAARRYAYIMARFEKYSTEGSRSARSPAFERAYGKDQELERLANEPDGIEVYEKRAKQARKEYNRLIKVMRTFEDKLTGRNVAKNVLDDMCCSDVEPPSQYRENVAQVLSAVASEFGVTVNPRRTGRRGSK